MIITEEFHVPEDLSDEDLARILSCFELPVAYEIVVGQLAQTLDEIAMNDAERASIFNLEPQEDFTWWTFES